MPVRNLYVTIIYLGIISLPLYGQWEILNRGIRGKLNSMDFVDDKTGWLAGDKGTLLMTEDGGRTWHEIPIKDGWYIQGIDFIDQTEGWATGWDSSYEYNLIIHTLDGGASWTVQKKEKNIYFYAPQAIDDSIVIVGSSTTIYKTVNGGSAWTDISPPGINVYLSSLIFLDRDTGIATGSLEEDSGWLGIIFKTYDGGSNWEVRTISEFSELSSIQMINDSLGYFVATGDTGGTFLYQTKDTCNTWSMINTGDCGIESYFWTKHGDLYAVVYDTLYDHYLLKSGDGGKTWEKTIVLHNWQVSQMYLNDFDQGILLFQLFGWGESSTQLIMTNFFDPGEWLTRNFSYDFADVYFHDPDNGFAFGGYYFVHGPTGGDIFSTKDGGVTWSLDHNLPLGVQTCSFLNEFVGYALLGGCFFCNSRLYKTTDGGVSWSPVYYNEPDSVFFFLFYHDIFFISDNVGFAVGHFWLPDSTGYGIFKTSDGGKNWDLWWNTPAKDETFYDLTAMHYVDTTIWAVGQNGFIVALVNPDSFRIIEPKTDLPLNDVFFSDAQHGWIAGGYWSDQDARPILLNTTDGGGTWKVDAGLPLVINEIYFRDNRQGWLVGADSTGEGMILATGDGGDSWTIQAKHLPAPLNGLHMIGDTGWAVGEQGVVLRTDNGGASWIDARKSMANPQTFKLYQNYPNPFNPSTVISWQMAVSSEVKLTVYNLLGERVANLVLGYMPAGYHSYHFEDHNLASGVYYYQLKAGDFKDVKKMLLLR